MKLSLLFLIIASTPFASNDLALASAESERTNVFEFDNVPRYLRANSTIELEDEERTNMRAGFEKLASSIPDFEYHQIKASMEKHVKSKVSPVTGDFQEIRQILFTLCEPEFLQELHRVYSIRFDTYLNIALYLVLLDSANGKVEEVARHIHNVIASEPNDTRFSQEVRNIVPGLEEAQFLLWSIIVGDLKQVKRSILGGDTAVKWRNNARERYQNFFANKAKRGIPGMEKASTSTS